MAPPDRRPTANAGPAHGLETAWSPIPRDAPTVIGEISLPGYRDFVAIARGGDGIVYRAQQVGLDREVAVKVLYLDDPETIERFHRELDITVGLGRQHPHIVTVLDTGTTDQGQPCIVMDLYDLGSLHDQVREHGPLPVSDVVTAGTVVADALAFAHGQGVLHRDVKPQNILVLPTSYVLADFGIARRIDAGHSVSLERFSYRHASPQVLDGEPPMIVDDVYSLGSTLFTLLDGRPPFAVDDPDEDTALAYLRRARTEPPRRLGRTDVPAALAAIIDRCLAKRRESRYPDAGILRDALASVPTESRAWAPHVSGYLDAPRTPSITGGVEPAFDAAKVPPAAAPPPAEVPGPVARSALAHLDDRPAPPPVRDPEATSTRIVPPETVDDDEEELPPPRWPWRRIGTFAAVALLIGSLLGLTGAWLRRSPAATQQPGATATGPQQGAPVPSFTGALPSRTGPPQVDVNDPKLTPQIIVLEDRGTSVVLRWTDPSDGEARFVVVQVLGSSGLPLAVFSPGKTEALIEGLDPVARYCFQIVAITSAGQAASPMRCTGKRPR